MLRETFLDLLGNYGNITITFYSGDEIPAIVKMDVISIEDYNDEIVVRGENGEFVILQGEPEETSSPVDGKEFIFTNNDLKIGVVL